MNYYMGSHRSTAEMKTCLSLLQIRVSTSLVVAREKSLSTSRLACFYQSAYRRVKNFERVSRVCTTLPLSPMSFQTYRCTSLTELSFKASVMKAHTEKINVKILQKKALKKQTKSFTLQHSHLTCIKFFSDSSVAVRTFNRSTSKIHHTFQSTACFKILLNRLSKINNTEQNDHKQHQVKLSYNISLRSLPLTKSPEIPRVRAKDFRQNRKASAWMDSKPWCIQTRGNMLRRPRSAGKNSRLKR